MKNIEFITRVQVDGVKEEISPEKAKEIILKRVQEALTGMNYEKKWGRRNERKDSPCTDRRSIAYIPSSVHGRNHASRKKYNGSRIRRDGSVCDDKD